MRSDINFCHGIVGFSCFPFIVSRTMFQKNLMLEVCTRPCLEKSLLTFAFLGVSGPNAERHKLLSRHSGILVFSIYRFQNHVPEKHTRMGGVKLMLEVCIRPCREKFPFTLGLWGVSGPKAERHKLFSRYNGILVFSIFRFQNHVPENIYG